MRMKKLAYVAILALTAGLFTMNGAMAFTNEDDDEKRFSLHGEIRTRWEYTANYDDRTDHDNSGGSNDDAYDFWNYRARIAAKGMFTRNVVGYVELQSHGYFGDSEGRQPYPVDPDPLLQNDEDGNVDETEVYLYQAYIDMKNIRDGNLSVRIGRAEHTDGTELQMGDLDFYGGLVFDGVRGTFDWEPHSLDLFYYYIDDDNADGLCTNFCGDDNTNFSGITYNWDLEERQQEVGAYMLWYRNAMGGEADYWTIGARWARLFDEMDNDTAADNRFDWNIELATQTGDIGGPSGEESQGSTLFEGWFGYNFAGNSRHRIALGYFQSSGDDDNTDDDQNAYVFLYTDVHDYNRLGDSDLQFFFFNYGGNPDNTGDFADAGITNFNLSYRYWSPNETQHIMFAYHNFRLTEDANFSGEDDFGQEFDLTYHWDYTNLLGIQFGIAYFMPGDTWGVNNIGGNGLDQDDPIQRFWAQARLRF